LVKMCNGQRHSHSTGNESHVSILLNPSHPTGSCETLLADRTQRLLVVKLFPWQCEEARRTRPGSHPSILSLKFAS
jgi:hypothetical protein